MTGKRYDQPNFDQSKGNGALPWLLLAAIGLLGYSLYRAFQYVPPGAVVATPSQTTQALPLPKPDSSALQADRPHLELGTIESTSSNPTLPQPATLKPTTDLPTLDHSDAWMRQQAGGLSGETHYQVWLRNEQLLRKLALLVDNLGEGQLPPRSAGALPRLSAPFAVKAMGEAQLYQLDPAGYQRYKSLLEAFAALDDGAVVTLYLRCKPLLQAAYAELGNANWDFDAALIAAIDRMLAIHLPKGPVDLIRPSVMYKYADPALEKLAPLEKQLIRMGPNNAITLQNKLRRLREALRQVPKQPAQAPAQSGQTVAPVLTTPPRTEQITLGDSQKRISQSSAFLLTTKDTKDTKFYVFS